MRMKYLFSLITVFDTSFQNVLLPSKSNSSHFSKLNSYVWRKHRIVVFKNLIHRMTIPSKSRNTSFLPILALRASHTKVYIQYSFNLFKVPQYPSLVNHELFILAVQKTDILLMLTIFSYTFAFLFKQLRICHYGVILQFILLNKDIRFVTRQMRTGLPNYWNFTTGTHLYHKL